MDDVAIILTTFERADNLESFFLSARKIYGNIPIYIADQDSNSSKKSLYKKYNVNVIEVGYDCGLSYARNILVKKAEHKYLLLAEDDFVFTEQSDYSNAKLILEDRGDICIVGGRYKNYHYKGNVLDRINYLNYEYVMSRNAASKALVLTHRTQVDKSRYFNDLNGIHYYCYDTANNFALLNRDTFLREGISWDDEIKVQSEHIDFYLNLKLNHEKFKVAYLPTFVVNHMRNLNNKVYKKYRYRNIYFKILFEKWGISHIVNSGNWSRCLTSDSGELTGLRKKRIGEKC